MKKTFLILLIIALSGVAYADASCDGRAKVQTPFAGKTIAKTEDSTGAGKSKGNQ